jgi:CDP-diacylglycerol--glycerol-3-phosphate 3-phosphatidyltransferase
MLDGFVARKSRNESKLGARIDSVADMIFVFVAMIKILPILDLTSRIVIWTAFIALVKIINVVYGYIRYRKIILPHTTANKITGLILFIAPFIIVSFDPIIPEIVICTIATIAAIHEGFYVGTKKSSSTISLDLLR